MRMVVCLSMWPRDKLETCPGSNSAFSPSQLGQTQETPTTLSAAESRDKRWRDKRGKMTITCNICFCIVT